MNTPTLRMASTLFILAARLAAEPLVPRPPPDKTMKPTDTEVFAPVPPVVSTTTGGAPSDAVILFNGGDLSAWQSAKTGQPAPWAVEDGAMVVVPGTGDICTRVAFGDIQLHIEFREPKVVVGNGQGRGNSGVLFMGLYELQVLDSHNNPTYVNGQAGAIYKQVPPLVNASKPPGEWQTYDAVWVAPRFSTEGKVLSPARLTLFHNGVLVQLCSTSTGPTMNQGHPHYFKHPAKLPLMLQEHRNPVAFRNIWVRELALPEQNSP